MAALIPAMLTISVVIPNYNRADLIGETLANVLGQTRPPDEVIVVDDGSTDDSARVIEGFGKRVTLIRQKNAGPGAARNRGLEAATGELIQFMDSDDLWSLNKLQAQERALSESGAGFAYSPWLQARLEGGQARHADPMIQQQPLPPSRLPMAWYLRGWVIVFQCCLFRRSLLDVAGPYREELMPSEDSELLFRILKSGALPVHVPEALTLYRLHGGEQISRGGMTRQRRARDWARYVDVVADQLADTAGLTDADRRHWRWRQFEAVRGLREAGIEPDSEIALGLSSRLGLQGDRLAQRVRAGLARRIGGSSFGPAYGPGPLDSRQEELLRAIGYNPVRVDHAELEGA